MSVAIFSGGPGAVFWMLVTSILDTAISYAECSLGQCYKIKQDGEYREVQKEQILSRWTLKEGLD